MKRIALFLLTNLAVLALLSIVVRVLGLDALLAQQAIGANGLLVLAAVIGFGGAFISLAMSKWMAKNRLSVRIIDRRRTKGEAWLVDTIASHAQHSGTGMPEVGIFDSLEMDAFATGARRDDSLVAVSSAIHANIMSFSSVSVVGNALRLNRVRL